MGAEARGPGTRRRRAARTPDAAPPTATSSPRRARRWRTTPPGARSPRCTAPTGRSGPTGLRDPRSAETARARGELMDRVDFHSRLAWLTDAQLATAQRAARDAGMARRDSSTTSRWASTPAAPTPGPSRTTSRAGMSVGAPPDAFNAQGQDWGLPPWRPDRLADVRLRPLPRLLRGLFRYAGALRIDHVMGLFRLWWVPRAARPPRAPMSATTPRRCSPILALEAYRAGRRGHRRGPRHRRARRTRGTARRGVLGTSVLWFERDWDGTGLPVAPRELARRLPRHRHHPRSAAHRVPADRRPCRTPRPAGPADPPRGGGAGRGGRRHGGVAGAARPARAAAKGPPAGSRRTRRRRRSRPCTGSCCARPPA